MSRDWTDFSRYYTLVKWEKCLKVYLNGCVHKKKKKLQSCSSCKTAHLHFFCVTEGQNKMLLGWSLKTASTVKSASERGFVTSGFPFDPIQAQHRERGMESTPELYQQTISALAVDSKCQVGHCYMWVQYFLCLFSKLPINLLHYKALLCVPGGVHISLPP